MLASLQLCRAAILAVLLVAIAQPAFAFRQKQKRSKDSTALEQVEEATLRVGEGAKSKWDIRDYVFGDEEEDACSKRVTGASVRNTEAFPFCKCKEYSDKVVCGSQRLKLAGRKFNVTEVLIHCDEKPYCSDVPAGTSVIKNCGDIADGQARDSEPYPSCKCRNHEHVVFCRDQIVAERKFNASDALEKCLEPFCSLCDTCEASDPLVRMLLVAVRPIAEAPLKDLGLTWEEVEPVLDRVDSVTELRQILKDPATFFADALKKFALKKLEPVATPWLNESGVTWEEVLPVLELMDIKTLKVAWKDPKIVIEEVARTSGPLAWTLTLGKLKPALEPWLVEHHIQWDDIEPILHTVPSVEELVKGLDDPAKFIEELARTSGPLAWQLALGNLQPKVQPWLEEHHLLWSDVLPILEWAFSVDQLIEAVQDPTSFMEELTKQSGALAWQVAMNQLQPLVEPWLESKNMSWEDIQPILLTVDSLDDLKTAANDPLAFMERLADMSAPLAWKLVKQDVEHVASPLLESYGMKWVDVVPYIDDASYTSIDDMKSAVADPKAFLERLGTKCGKFAWQMALTTLDKELGPWLDERNLTIEDITSGMAHVDSLEKLKEASKNPAGFTNKLASEYGPLAWKLAMHELQPLVTPWLEEKNLSWSDVVPALTHVDSLAKLQEGARDPVAFMERLLNTSGMMMWEVAKAELKPHLNAVLAEWNMTWEDVSAILSNARSVEELAGAAVSANSSIELAHSLAVQSGRLEPSNTGSDAIAVSDEAAGENGGTAMSQITFHASRPRGKGRGSR